MKVSQSTTKELGLYIIDGQLEKGDVCPALYNWRQNNDTESKAMTYGKYGETMLIGGGRGGEQTTELPRKKNGDRYIGHVRLDNQIPLAKEFMEEHGMIIGGNTQVPLFTSKLFNKYGVNVRGELDIFPTPVDDNPCCVVDVKLSQDIYNGFWTPKRPSLSSYCWGAPDMLNINQPLFYHWLIRNSDKDELIELYPKYKALYEFMFSNLVQRNIDNALFYFFVIGYGKPVMVKNGQLLLHPVPWNKTNEGLFYYLLEASVERLNEFKDSGFAPKKIDMKTCDKCPIREQNKCSLFK